MEDKKTGKIESKDAVWVRVGGVKREKYEDIQDSKSGTKQFVSDKPTSAVVQSINKRVKNFATGLDIYIV